MKRLFLFLLLALEIPAWVAAQDGRRCGKIDFFGDLLYWNASEQTNSMWANAVTTSLSDEGISDTLRVKNISFDWNYGFRVGAGCELPCDHWDTQLYWSQYRTQANSHLEQALIGTEYFAGFINGDTADSGSVRWSLSYRMLDWELGRRCCLGKGLTLRPYIGLKGGWIDQTIHSKWHVILKNQVLVDYSSTENLTNNFWGIGPSCGINTEWQCAQWCNQRFHLFGDFSGAGMWGNWSNSDVYHNTALTNFSANMRDSKLGSLMLRAFMGLGWGVAYNHGRSHFTAKLGYEIQYWINQLRMSTFQQLRLHGDLILQGGTLNCRLDF